MLKLNNSLITWHIVMNLHANVCLCLCRYTAGEWHDGLCSEDQVQRNLLIVNKMPGCEMTL